jgi:hypothetical protein
MQNPTNFIDVFISKTEELEKSKFILADKKIGGVLKCIVGNGGLFELVKECLNNFDFVEAFDKAKTPVAGQYSNRFSLVIPTDKKKLIAFTFCLLADFDNKRRDLHQFLQEYFYEDGSVYEGWRRFSYALIKPFKKAVETLFRDEGHDSDDPLGENVRNAEKYFDASFADNVAIDNMLVEELTMLIQDVSMAIASDGGLNADEKKDMLDITEGLGNAIITKDARLIHLLWIGFKSAIRDYKGSHEKSVHIKVEQIEKKLKERNI